MVSSPLTILKGEVVERIEEVVKWFRKKWIGVVLPILGLLIVSLGSWIIYTSSEGKVRSFGAFVVILGFLFMFGLLKLF